MRSVLRKLNPKSHEKRRKKEAQQDIISACVFFTRSLKVRRHVKKTSTINAQIISGV